MNEEILGRNDMLAPPSSTPPAAKISREIGNVVREIVVLLCVTTALVTNKLEPMWFVVIVMSIITGHFARSKAEGALDVNALVELLKR
jgi:hypothetical protein